MGKFDSKISDSIKSIEFGISSAESEFNDIRSEQINNATPNTSASASIFSKTSLSGFMGLTDLLTTYYFDINKDTAINEWVSNFGEITSGPIDINDKIEETLNAAYQVNMEFILNDRP